MLKNREIFLVGQKAFNKVWHVVLLLLIALGLPSQLIKTYADNFKNRSFMVRVGNSFCNPKPIQSSVPQGSLSSATPFSTCIYNAKKTANLAISANETAFLQKHPHTVFSKLQDYLVQISVWLTKWKNKENNARSGAIFFTNENYPRCY